MSDKSEDIRQLCVLIGDAVINTLREADPPVADAVTAAWIASTRMVRNVLNSVPDEARAELITELLEHVEAVSGRQYTIVQ